MEGICRKRLGFCSLSEHLERDRLSPFSMRINDTVMNAIRELRERLRMTQVTFAVKVGKSYSSIQRYEGKEPPPPQELLVFLRLARQCGYSDLATLFKTEALKGMSPELIELIREDVEIPKSAQ
jgi:DNA-binding transcriptional regulator YiaG